MRRRLATLFVDMAGSTRLVIRHAPETVLGAVRCFATLVTEVAGAHGGRVKDFEGDGVLLYFISARSAASSSSPGSAGTSPGWPAPAPPRT